MHSDAFFLSPSFTVRLKCFLDNTPAFSKINPEWKSVFRPFLKKAPKSYDRNIGKVVRDNIACTEIHKWRVSSRDRRLNRTPNIRVRNDLVVVENDISNRFFVLITSKRRIKILEIGAEIKEVIL